MSEPTTPCSVPECNTDGSGEPCDRHETEQAHTEGEHAFCDIECEAILPSDQLRNAILCRAIPGSKNMLAELERRAARTTPDNPVTSSNPADNPDAPSCAGCAGCGGPDCAQRPEPAGPALRDRIAGALIARIKQAVIIDPGPFSGMIGQPFAATEYDLAHAVLAALQPELAELADYRNRITWETTCGEHARLLDSCYAETTRAETAEAALARVREVARRLTAHAAGFQDVLDDTDRDPWAKTVRADLDDLNTALTPPADQPNGSAR